MRPARKTHSPAVSGARWIGLMVGLAALSLVKCEHQDRTLNHEPAAISKIVIGYYPSYRKAAFRHTDINYAALSHIAHASTWPDAGGNLIIPDDYLYPELNVEAHAKGVKVIMSVGGWGNCDEFAGMCSTSTTRARFIGQAIDFCKANGYDGVDVDWEFVDTPAERADFISFIHELSAALKSQSPRLLLSMAAPAGDYYAKWIDFELLSGEFDFIGFMTYDFHGPWSDHSGHNSPLRPDAGDTCGSVTETYAYARGRQVPVSKLLLGVPFYGRSFDCGELGHSFATSHEYSYADVMTLLGSGWLRIWDTAASVPFARRSDAGLIIGYDDQESVAAKCDYVLAAPAAGIIIWELSQDYRNGKSELLEVVGQKFGVR